MQYHGFAFCIDWSGVWCDAMHPFPTVTWNAYQTKNGHRGLQWCLTSTYPYHCLHNNMRAVGHSSVSRNIDADGVGTTYAKHWVCKLRWSALVQHNSKNIVLIRKFWWGCNRHVCRRAQLLLYLGEARCLGSNDLLIILGKNWEPQASNGQFELLTLLESSRVLYIDSIHSWFAHGLP